MNDAQRHHRGALSGPGLVAVDDDMDHVPLTLSLDVAWVRV